MVDDGSTDGSAEIARRRAESDPRFILIRVPNGGPGYSRNRGIEQATGEFLAFVDADDMLPSHALEIMLHTLQESGSDFVSGGVERIGPLGVTPSGMHAQAIKNRRIGTHISRSPELFWDVSVWNKLFRKSFWDASKLSFPEVRAWEDLQAMTRAHVLAKAVDVIPDTIYYWRERGKGALSITQSRTDIGNLRDRITALSNIDRFLRERASATLLREHQRKALVNDLWLYVCDLVPDHRRVPGRVHGTRAQVPGPGRPAGAGEAAIHAQARLPPDQGRPAGAIARVQRLAGRAADQDNPDGQELRQDPR